MSLNLRVEAGASHQLTGVNSVRVWALDADEFPSDDDFLLKAGRRGIEMQESMADMVS